MYEKLELQLKRLSHELRRLKDYESLFSHSEDMQDFLVSSYVNIIKFWSRVEEQCMTSEIIIVTKALSSLSSKKLDEILADITEDGKNIAKLVPIIQERLRRGENENAAEERRKAGIILGEMLKIQVSEQDGKSLPYHTRYHYG
jgi:hypothetical protein